MEHLELAEKIVKEWMASGCCKTGHTICTDLYKHIALALDQAEAEGAERVVKAVEVAKVCETDNFNDFVVVCKDCQHSGCSEDRSIAKNICVVAARQALQEVKGKEADEERKGEPPSWKMNGTSGNGQRYANDTRI